METEFTRLYNTGINYLKEIRKVVDESPYIGYSPDEFYCCKHYKIKIVKKLKAGIPGTCPTYEVTKLVIFYANAEEDKVIMSYTTQPESFEVEICDKLVEFIKDWDMNEFKDYADMKNLRSFINSVLDSKADLSK